MERFALILLCSAMVVVTIATSNHNCKKMVTFNTGLTNRVGTQQSRLSKIIRALRESGKSGKSGDDFICLQEVWTEDEMTVILEKVKSEFPNHWSPIHADKDQLRQFDDETGGQKDTPCSSEESNLLRNDIIACGYRNNCYGQTPAVGQTQVIRENFCLALKCQAELRNPRTPQSCISCLFSQSPSSFRRGLQACMSPKRNHNRFNMPGLLVLSKTNLTNVVYQSFQPGSRTTLERGYIKAELDDGKKVGCTQLSLMHPIYFEYDLTFGSYENQAKDEIRKLRQTFAGESHILLGDFNTGPKWTNRHGERNLTGEHPLNYDLLMSGYRSPYMEKDARCTLCKNNPLAGHNRMVMSLTSPKNDVIDQVLVSPPDAFSTPLAERVFDSAGISFHYGVRVEVCDP